MSDSVTVTTAEEPELTKDTNAEFSVSDTVNLDPQTVEYNTTPEVVEYQKLEECKDALEAYTALLNAAGGQINGQSEAVMNVHLAQIAKIIDRPAMGLEAFNAGVHSVFRTGTVSVEALGEQINALCDRLNRHPANEKFHHWLTVSTEDDQGGEKKQGIIARFFAWLREMYQKFKDYWSGRWDAMLEKCDTLKDRVKLLVEHTDIAPYLKNHAWGGGKYLGRTVEPETNIMNWIERKYLPWQEKTWKEALQFVEGFDQFDESSDITGVYDEIEKWKAAHQIPDEPPKDILGDDKQVVMEDGVRITVEKEPNADKLAERENFPEKALTSKEYWKLLDEVRLTIRRGQAMLVKEFNSPELASPNSMPEIAGKGSDVVGLFTAINRVNLYRRVWTALEHSLHGKIEALGVEINSASREASMKSIDNHNVGVRKAYGNHL